MSISLTKSQIRLKLKNERNSINLDELLSISSIINEKVFSMLKKIKAKHVNCFVGDVNRKEIQTIPLLERLLENEFIVSVPVMRANFELEIVQIQSLEELTPNKWGILEPRTLKTPISEPDVIIVPMLAADLDKNRLGYGAGYYDRFLSRFESITSIGIVAQSFIFKKLPTDYYDIPLDLILTETTSIE